jgi:ribosome-binding factor A
MSGKRTERISGEMQRVISDIIHNELKDPGLLGMSSVMDVEVTRDLEHAKVRVSVLGTKEEQKSAIESLVRATGFIRKTMAKRIRMRRIPELHFMLDDSIEYSIRMSHLIDSISQENPEINNGD